MTKNIVAIAGSLRKGSYNSSLISAAQKIGSSLSSKGAEHDLAIEILDISSLPLFDQDVEAAGFPEAAQAMKDKIAAADGVIIATPEYNRSVPGVLKNAIDWMSRPYGQNSFAGKPTLVMGASMGPIATAVAQSHLKQIMLYLDAKVIGQPEIYVGTAHEKFDASGELIDESTTSHLEGALRKLVGWTK
ncbi:MAG TPA: NADPH-dependent FMN reductase [Candidatus Paceibacterota bacterium]